MSTEDRKNSEDDVIMIEACKNGDASTTMELISKKDYDCKRTVEWVDEDQKTLQTPSIFIAVDYGQTEIVQKLIEADGSLVNIKDSNDYSPLEWASWNGHVDLVNLLIGKGAKVDQDALDLAKEYGHKEIASIIFEKIDLYEDLGGDIDEIMIKASREGDISKVQELIGNGYDFDKWKKEDGSYQEYSPIYIAMKNGHIQIIQEFIQAGVKADLQETHFHDV